MKKNRKDSKKSIEGSEVNEHAVKSFDKKTYRLKKYSNKYKIEKWEDRRKKAVLRRYYKDVQKDQKNYVQKPNVEEDSKDDEDADSSNRRNKGNAFHAAKIKYLEKKEEKKRMKEEAQRKKKEKTEALKKYKEEKVLKYKKLSKKTRKGQPVMKDRLEMLLDKIQRTT